jgi:hypothetical protein
MYIANRNYWIIAILVLGLLGILSCSKKSAGGDDGDDGNTPYNILDLRVSSATDSSVTLIWTATGDDADQGTASLYDIRYWRTWITEENWDSTFQVASEPHPSPAGQTDSMRITGLRKDSSYYFALLACDEAGNCAPSGCVMGVCFTDMVVTFADSRLDSAVRFLISKPTGNILRSDLMSHNALFANDGGIASLAGIEVWTTVEVLFLGGNSITDLSPLANLLKLRGLGLSNNGVANIATLSSLVNLELLHLRANALSNISALSGLTKLHQLDISDNDITSLAPLVANSGLAGSDTIFVGQNPLSQQALTVDVPALQARGVTILGL